METFAPSATFSVAFAAHLAAVKTGSPSAYTETALRLLERLNRIADSDFIFSAPRGGQLSDMSLTQVLWRMEVDAVPHRLRSSFRDWAGERTNHPREVAEQALAHVLENKFEAAYRRGDALEKRNVLMKDLEAFIGKPKGYHHLLISSETHPKSSKQQAT